MFKLNLRGRAPRRFGVSVAFLVAMATLTHAVPAKAGLFDFLFGGLFGQQRTVAPQGSGVYASYCVRTCDGRYFPLPRTSAPQQAQVCQSSVPRRRD